MDASLPKLDHSVFSGTTCTSIKEIEGLTASQIKALNLSICRVPAQSGAGEGSEWERDNRGEGLGGRQVVGSEKRGKRKTVAAEDGEKKNPSEETGEAKGREEEKNNRGKEKGQKRVKNDDESH